MIIWNNFTDEKPKDATPYSGIHVTKKYLCYVPESKKYHEHSDLYRFDGENFIDDNNLTNTGAIVPVSHWCEVNKPI